MKSLVLLVALAVICSSCHAAVHQFNVAHVQLPQEEAARRMALRVPAHIREEEAYRSKLHQAQKEFERHRLGFEATASQQLQQADAEQQNSSSSSSIPVEIQNYGYAMVANISVGSPPQTVTVEIDPYDTDLYIVAAGANYTTWRAANAVTNKTTFNSSDSTTYTPNNAANFSRYWAFRDGVVGSDLVQIGSNLTVNLAIQLASSVSTTLQYYTFAGSLGISSATPWSNDSLPTVQQQLLPNLDLPVITQQINRPTLRPCCSDPGGSGVIAFGGLIPDVCDSQQWQELSNSTSYYNYPQFNVTSISSSAIAEGDCTNAVQAVITINFVPYTTLIYTSYQVMGVFIAASNATWNQSAYYYTPYSGYVLPADQIANAQPVSLQLQNGGVLELQPEDYLVVLDGVANLNVLGSYDQNRYPRDYFTLGQDVLNRRCLSQNIQTGAWSITTVVQGSNGSAADGENNGQSPTPGPAASNSTADGGDNGQSTTPGPSASNSTGDGGQSATPGPSASNSTGSSGDGGNSQQSTTPGPQAANSTGDGGNGGQPPTPGPSASNSTSGSSGGGDGGQSTTAGVPAIALSGNSKVSGLEPPNFIASRLARLGQMAPLRTLGAVLRNGQ